MAKDIDTAGSRRRLRTPDEIHARVARILVRPAEAPVEGVQPLNPGVALLESMRSSTVKSKSRVTAKLKG